MVPVVLVSILLRRFALYCRQALFDSGHIATLGSTALQPVVETKHGAFAWSSASSGL